MTLTAENALFGHTSEDTAYLVSDYPYSWKLRCQIRYWIETTKHGDRMCSQTLNPKNDRWNKPKKGTYSPVAVMYLNDEEHVTHASVSPNSSDEWLDTFRAVTDSHLSDEQKANLTQVIATKKVWAEMSAARGIAETAVARQDLG